MRKIFLLFAIITTGLYAQNNPKQTEIKVSAEGKTRVVPDMVVISFGIETKGEESEKVKKENDIMYEKVLKLLKVNKIDQKDIKSKWFSLYPRYENKEDKTYYVANQNLDVRVRDISKYEIIVNELVKTGVNRMDYITFESSKIEKLRTESRKSAVEEARKKATDFANALELKVGQVVSVTDDTQDYFGYDYYNSGLTQEAQTIETNTFEKSSKIGEIEIKTLVTITFLLE